jgi:hypothetical protein
MFVVCFNTHLSNLWIGYGRFLYLQVREAQLAQFNYILVVGAQEAETGEVRLRAIFLCTK